MRFLSIPTPEQIGTAIIYSIMNLSIEGAAHRVIDGVAVATKTTITLANTWIISPLLWWFIGTTLQTSAYLAKSAATGVYHFFIPAQEAPVLLITDKPNTNNP